MLKSNPKYSSVFIVLLSLFATQPLVAADKDEQPKIAEKKDDYFAFINKQKISSAEFIYRFRKALSEKFFHGKVSDDELNAFKKEVAEQLVLEILLDQEARKTGLQTDAGKIAQKLEEMDEKFSNSESAEERDSWSQSREEVLPIIKARIEREILVERLQDRTKNVAQPSVQAVKDYYEKNKDKFTEPQQWNVSIILLSVDPSSSPEIWQETVEKADNLLKKIRKGESFEELARIHSADESAFKGGHMGYMHIGMFGAPAQQVLNVMEPGEISEPVVLLEGVALFRLNDVRKASLNTFEDVEERARNLLMRELGEKAWKDLQLQVRKSAEIKYSDLIMKDLEVSSKTGGG